MFDPEKFVNKAIEDLKEAISGTAVIACSGGVDSTVAAVLVARAIGDRLYGVHVDTGYMRKNESEDVAELLRDMGVNLQVAIAGEEFSEALKGAVEPEAKRKAIGHTFIRIFERYAKEIDAKYLVQGTIAPDWIESGGDLRDVIKSHHNVGALPEDMDMSLVEPLRDLYKDEVRKVGRYLGISIAEKQPFPGPGLAIRIIGEATLEKAEIVREACFIVEDELEKAAEAGKMEIPWQYFAVLTSAKTVGVQGDVRAYGHTVAVRAVQSIDGMTAAYSKVPHEVLEKISIRITNTMPGKINRVVYDITNKPPGTIEWE
ncbi:MAG: glutamine-hydrolyzing GMP synthase subunit GuaA [Thermoplasmata archaeon]|nr:glutamine-hydrolyzing GMP synthase subunit GuaA [Thermoplasmata archaeon]